MLALADVLDLVINQLVLEEHIEYTKDYIKDGAPYPEGLVYEDVNDMMATLFLFATLATRGLGVRGRPNPLLGEREKSDALKTMRIIKKHLRIGNDKDGTMPENR